MEVGVSRSNEPASNKIIWRSAFTSHGAKSENGNTTSCCPGRLTADRVNASLGKSRCVITAENMSSAVVFGGSR